MVGGDAKIGITPALALDLTVNTDFAQVEVDNEQVDLTRFSLFFPEKHPFFLGSDVFQSEDRDRRGWGARPDRVGEPLEWASGGSS